MGNVVFQGSLGCGDHEMVEFRMLRAVRKPHSKLRALDFRIADSGVFRGLLGRIPWDRTLEGRGAQEQLLFSKDHLLQAQKGCIRQGGNQANRPEGLHGRIRPC